LTHVPPPLFRLPAAAAAPAVSFFFGFWASLFVCLLLRLLLLLRMAVCVVCWSVPFYIASFSACRCAFHSISRHATAFNGDTSSIVFSGVVHPLHELGLNDSIRIKRPTVAATSHQQLRENQSNLNSFSLIESISFITLHRLFFLQIVISIRFF